MNMNNGVSNEYHYSHKMQSLIISLAAQADEGVPKQYVIPPPPVKFCSFSSRIYLRRRYDSLLRDLFVRQRDRSPPLSIKVVGPECSRPQNSYYSFCLF